MNRRTKIIVSVVGIFIVLLALIGITYAYFLTRIEGNTNDTSISITTANLRIVYDDNNSGINVTNLQPTKNEYYVKTFTVTNEGNETVDYEVYLENVINDFVNEEDLLMFVTCESNIDGNTCNGFGDGRIENEAPVFGTSIYPTVNSKMIENSIEPASDGTSKEIHTYKLYLMFYDDDTDQSDDMNKIIQGKVQIYDPKDVVAITGEVTNYTVGDYVELHSDVKTSEIKKDENGKYTYIFYGVESDDEAHTIYIKNKGSNGTVTTVGSKTINVTKGTNASISSDGLNIVINDSSYKATVNISIPNTKDSITLTGVSVKEYNPYDDTTLAYQIYKNKAQIQKYTKDGETYTENGIELNKDVKTLTKVKGIADGTVLSDNGLFKAEDDYGTSYIYRGSVINNYVDFAGFTWRIVRINGDGSVRLILDGVLDKICVEYDTDGETCTKYAGSTSSFSARYSDNAYVGYTYGQAGVTEGNGEKTAYDLTHEYTGNKNSEDKTGQSTIKLVVDTFYKTYLLDNYHDYISDTLFCGDKSLASSGIGGIETQLGYGTNETYYAAFERLYRGEITPTLKCAEGENNNYSRYTVSGDDISGIKANDDLIYPIALLSADELVMSGAFKLKTNLQYYLYNTNILSNYWWTMTPNSSYINSSIFRAREFISKVPGDSLVDYAVSYNGDGVRPVINLSYDKALYDDGTGTSIEPYKVRLAN